MNKTLMTNFTPKLKYKRTWNKNLQVFQKTMTWNKAFQDEQNLGTNFIQKLNKYKSTSTTQTFTFHTKVEDQMSQHQ
jgi:hypothetical protein